jgi:hypothetical protein
MYPQNSTGLGVGEYFDNPILSAHASRPAGTGKWIRTNTIGNIELLYLFFSEPNTCHLWPGVDYRRNSIIVDLTRETR